MRKIYLEQAKHGQGLREVAQDLIENALLGACQGVRQHRLQVCDRRVLTHDRTVDTILAECRPEQSILSSSLAGNAPLTHQTAVTGLIHHRVGV